MQVRLRSPTSTVSKLFCESPPQVAHLYRKGIKKDMYMLFVLDIMQVTFFTELIVDFKSSCQQPVSTLRVWARKQK